MYCVLQCVLCVAACVERCNLLCVAMPVVCCNVVYCLLCTTNYCMLLRGPTSKISHLCSQWPRLGLTRELFAAVAGQTQTARPSLARKACGDQAGSPALARP